VRTALICRSAAYGNGVQATFNYSSDRLQLTSIGYAKGTQPLFGINYWYKQDATNCSTGVTGNNDQVQCITDTVDSGRNTSYTYDALYRLSSAVTTGSTNYPKWGLSWSYDRYGNRWSQTQTAGSPPTNSLSFANPGGALTNRQDSMCFDANGNLQAETESPCPAPTYVYDGENRLVNYQSASYMYDFSGNRVEKQYGGTTTIYIFSGSKVLAEYDNGASVTSPSREYIYSGATLLAEIQSGVTTYFNADQLSTRLVTDLNGNVLGQRGHYPFGETWYETGTITKWKFTSYERDAESANDYAIARSFVNRFGRFSSPDLVSGGADTPQSLNRYSYVLNDPCDHMDPLGMKPCFLNLKIVTSKGVTLSDSDIAAITSRINSLLSSAAFPSGATVQVQTSYAGDTDYTLSYTNAGDSKLEMGLITGQLKLGDAPVGGVGGTVYADAVSLAEGLSQQNYLSNLGTVGTHELTHLAGVPDQQYTEADFDNVNLMMMDTAPKALQQNALRNPNSPLNQLTPEQLAAIAAACTLKHPKVPPKKNGSGPEDIISSLGCQLWTWVWDDWDDGIGHSECLIP
jgi:RHS repeat-associated protein